MIYLVSIYLLSACHMPGTVPGTGAMTANKTEKPLPSWSYVLVHTYYPDAEPGTPWGAINVCSLFSPPL